MLSGFLHTGLILDGLTSNLNTLFSMPNIGALYEESHWYSGNAVLTKIINTLNNIFKLGFPIYTDNQNETAKNSIGEQVLIENTGTEAGTLSKIADNIVPEPRIWNIHGYMGFQPMTISFGENNATGILTKLFNTFGRDTLNSLIKEYVRYVHNSRKPFKFTTSEGETVPALIKEYKFSNKAENSNYIEVDFEIQEFRWIGLASDETQYAGGGYNYSFAKTANVLARSVAKSLLL